MSKETQIVDRFDASGWRSPDGCYVRYSDYDRLRAALENLVLNVAGEQYAECEIEKQLGRGVARAVAAARAALDHIVDVNKKVEALNPGNSAEAEKAL